MNLLIDVPDAFSGIFTTFWVFAVVIGVVSVIFTILFIVLIVFVVRKAMKRNEQVFDNAIEMQEKALEEKECQYCGGLLKGTDRECPHCSAPVKYND